MKFLIWSNYIIMDIFLSRNDNTASMLYIGQSRNCKQYRLVSLEKTFVFQTSDFPAQPAAYSFSSSYKIRLHIGKLIR